MDITEQQQELIESDNVTPELASQLLWQAMNDGDTTTQTVETGSEPDTTQAGNDKKSEETAGGTQQNQEQQAQQQQPMVDESQLNAENAVIVARDGKHHIPFEKLAEARNAEKEWKQKYDEAHQQLAQLQANAQERKDNNVQTAQDQKVDVVQQAINNGTIDPSIFGDFSEEAMVKGVEQAYKILSEKQIDERVQAYLAPLLQQQQVSAEQAHFNEIFTAHPDAESIVESKEFNTWLDNQPSITKDAYSTVLNKGSASQVVELLGLYKSGTQSTQATQQQNDAVRVAAMQAVNKAPTNVPHSVTDFPAGNPTGQSNDERLANLSGPELLAEMSKWTPEQIDAYYARNA